MQFLCSFSGMSRLLNTCYSALPIDNKLFRRLEHRYGMIYFWHQGLLTQHSSKGVVRLLCSAPFWKQYAMWSPAPWCATDNNNHQSVLLWGGVFTLTFSDYKYSCLGQSLNSRVFFYNLYNLWWFDYLFTILLVINNQCERYHIIFMLFLL